MQGITLTLALIASLLVLTLRKDYALITYIASLLWYPSYLAISIGTIDIPVGRFVVAVLLLRCLCDNGIRSKFVWSRLDTYVALCMLTCVGMALFSFTPPVSSIVENRGGFLMDTWFAYLVVRLIVTDHERLKTVIKCIGVVLVPLAILGVMESVTGWQPFAPLWRYSPWYREGAAFTSDARFGFNRAIGPFSHAILFGGGFAMFLPLVYYLRHEDKGWRSFAYVLSGAAILGALSSMSSGPWVMTIVAIFCLVMERHKQWVKPVIVFVVFSCIFVEIASNRSFYHVITSRLNPLSGAGWHRSELIDVAIKHFDEWWLTGYGDRDPGWGHYFGMVHTDVTNQFILAGVRHGILGIIALCAVVIAAFRAVLRTYKRAKDRHLRSLCWSLGASLTSVVVTWMSVSFFGQINSLFYCVLGIIGSSVYFVGNERITLRKVIEKHQP